MKVIPKQTMVNAVLSFLEERYAEAHTRLHYQNPFELLVATILSAQCTDAQVNKVTRSLFQNVRTPLEFASIDQAALEQLIKPTGFFRNKAKNLIACARMLITNYQGEVPPSLSELIKLPGVGRKTANVVLGSAFGMPGIVVDTHVARTSQRLGLSSSQRPDKIEEDLMQLIPEAKWSRFSLQLIYFGREICHARRPHCHACQLVDICIYPHKTVAP
jgi:endonuclease-3